MKPVRPTSTHRPKKRLGQNFLRDRTVLDKILVAAELTTNDQVLEIGPGRGALTEVIAPHCGHLTAVEIDRGLQDYLAPLSARFPNLEIRFGDFMKAEWTDMAFDPTRPVKVVANIPYYITTPILLKLLQSPRIEREPLVLVPPLAERILLMVQWEVARRLVATPGSKDYGSLSIVANYAAEVSIVTKVPAGAFYPRPEVDSAVVMLKPRHEAPALITSVPTFFRVVRGAFQQRRKTLQNGLLGAGFERGRLEAAVSATGLDLGRRAETLSLAEFASLANALS